MTSLFSFTTSMHQYYGRRVRWVRTDREEPAVPYARSIRDYDRRSPDRSHAEWAVDELFTSEEAMKLIKHFEKNSDFNGVTSYKEHELPIDQHSLRPRYPFDCHFKEWKYPDCSLPFKVEGFFDPDGEIEQLLAEHPDWTSAQACAEVSRWPRN